MKKTSRIIIVLAALFAVTASQTVEAAKETKEKQKTYPVDTCIVTGQKLGSMGDPYKHMHEGRAVYFCCAGCTRRFESKADDYLKELDKKIIEHQKDDYPLKACVVSGEPLEQPIDLVHDNRLVRLCCQGCVRDFEKQPRAYMKKLNEGEKKQRPATQPKKSHDH